MFVELKKQDKPLQIAPNLDPSVKSCVVGELTSIGGSRGGGAAGAPPPQQTWYEVLHKMDCIVILVYCSILKTENQTRTSQTYLSLNHIETGKMQNQI